MASIQADLRRTPLYGCHQAAGARLVPFAGWEMPVQYTGIQEEHRSVRTGAGMFDVSHMGQIEVRGPGSGELLQRLLTNDLRRLSEGGAQYSLLCNEFGGVIDDLFAYRLAEGHYLVVSNASRHPADLAWFEAHAGSYDADVLDCSERFAMIAVQGPGARSVVRGLSDGDLPPRMHVCPRSVAGVAQLICGTGYTGEDGIELLIAPEGAEQVWQALLHAGVTPAGLGARDTLRTEVCYPLYGQELSEARNPIEAGLGWACRESTDFLGAEAVAEARVASTQAVGERLVAFVLEGEGIARPGNPVGGGGVVSSGTFSPTLGRGIGMAYVPAAQAEIGTILEIDVRGRPRRARVEARPLYRKEPRP